MRLNVVCLAIVGVVLSACTAQDPSLRGYAAAHLPVPGESYFGVPARSGLETAEFTRYAAAAEEALRARGLVRAANPESAALLVKMDFGVGLVNQQVLPRDPLRSFRRHLPDVYSSGSESQRLPTARRMEPQITSKRRDFVEVGVVRGSDNAVLFEGIATKRVTRSRTRALEPLVRAAFARWHPAKDTRI